MKLSIILILICAFCISGAIFCGVAEVAKRYDEQQWKFHKCQKAGGIYLATYDDYRCVKIEEIK